MRGVLGGVTNTTARAASQLTMIHTRFSSQHGVEQVADYGAYRGDFRHAARSTIISVSVDRVLGYAARQQQTGRFYLIAEKYFGYIAFILSVAGLDCVPPPTSTSGGLRQIKEIARCGAGVSAAGACCSGACLKLRRARPVIKSRIAFIYPPAVFA